MAVIQFQETGERMTDRNALNAFLESQGIIYEKWEMSKLPAHLRENFHLSDGDKQQILDVFQAEIQDISARRGYEAHDVIALSAQTPNLDELLTNFQKVHIHTDDEVRFIVSGHGIFAIQANDGQFFNVELEPGDLISVPVNTRHYFTLMEDRQVVAIRIFVTKEGWVPIYDEENN